jgi:type IV pilus assembly protein PilV
MKTNRPPKQNQRGATMIELLVSFLIFAFGMLGLVGTQNKTLAYSQISLYRSQATALTDDILDRMRADRANAKKGMWATAMNDAAAGYTGPSIAETDLKDWKTQIETLLPSGKASIVVNGIVVTVTIQWDERGATTPFQTISSL